MADAPRPNTLLGQGVQSAARSFTRVVGVFAKVRGTALGVLGGLALSGVAVIAGLAAPVLAVGALAGGGAGYLYGRHQAKKAAAVINAGASVIAGAVDAVEQVVAPAAEEKTAESEGVEL